MKNSINSTARIGGILYLIIILAGMFSVIFVREKLVVAGDPTATAQNIIAHQLLWRTGIATDLLMHICDIPLMLIIFILLRPVNKHLALLVVLFNVMQTSVLVANKLNLIAALSPLGSAGYLKVLDPNQLYIQSYLSIRLHDIGFGVGLIFFAFVCLIEGYLIYRSGYLPKLIGILMQIAGVCYLVNSFALILAPAFANMLFPAIMVPCFIAETAFCLWLLIKGVNVTEWEKREMLRTSL
jgi:hypothetical protein